MSRVLILGGGPAGLYAALLLARRNISTTVLEAAPRAGGLAAGLEVAGMRVDHGSHRLHPSIEPDILADLRRLLGDRLQSRPRHGRIRLGGAWLSFPLSPRELVSRLPASMTARLAAGAARAMVTRSDDASFASVVRTGLGEPMGDLFYYPYARKLWGVDPADLSGEQARRRISADSPWKLVRKAFSSGGGRQFLYPTEGFGTIPQALADAAAAAGTHLLLDSPVSDIRPTPRGWAVSAAGVEHRARLVLSTVPMTVLARLLRPPPEVAGATEVLASRAMVLVYLTVAVPRWTEFDAHYFPSDDVRFTRVSEPKNYRTSAADPTDRTVLCVEIPCDLGDEVWSSEEAALGESVREGILSQGLPDPGTDLTVRRLPHAYPVYGLDSGPALEVVDGWLGDQPSLVTFGRQGLFAHDNTHHALAMARDAVACVGSDLSFDDKKWAKARRRFASHVVED